MKQFIFLVLLLMSASASAEGEQILGSIEDGRYFTPKKDFSFKIPGGDSATPVKLKDAIFSASLNVIIENTAKNIRHRFELGHITEASLSKTIEKYLFQYNGLVSRAYPGTPLLIHFNETPGIRSYLYKQVSDKNVRFHFVQARLYKNRVIYTWSDFVENIDSPENEDRIIDGQHPAITEAQSIINSVE